MRWPRTVSLVAAGAALGALLAGGIGWQSGVRGWVRDAAALPSSASTPRPHARPAGAARWSCATAHGPFRVAGTRVFGADGKVYIPYGITLSGLEHPHYRRDTRRAPGKIRAIAGGWCANTVRLQLGQANLVGATGGRHSRRFLAAVRAQVRLAEREHLVVVLNDQTEGGNDQPAPTRATAVFWRDLARVYGHDPQVIFDLFNEPRVRTGSQARDWRLWQRGGRYHGHRYLGMQTLVRDVRADRARNLLWVEGPHWAGTLARVATHRIAGGPVVYAVHHPAGAHTPQVWTRDFGYLVARGIAPVVDGEWANYAATAPECWPNAPTAAPLFLRYLRRHGIGLTAWTLTRGVLIASTNPNDPTHLRASWACTHRSDQGVGSLLRHWYRLAGLPRPGSIGVAR